MNMRLFPLPKHQSIHNQLERIQCCCQQPVRSLHELLPVDLYSICPISIHIPCWPLSPKSPITINMPCWPVSIYPVNQYPYNMLTYPYAGSLSTYPVDQKSIYRYLPIYPADPLRIPCGPETPYTRSFSIYRVHHSIYTVDLYRHIPQFIYRVDLTLDITWSPTTNNQCKPKLATATPAAIASSQGPGTVYGSTVDGS